jgi:uncharacterized Zn-finger protein
MPALSPSSHAAVELLAKDLNRAGEVCCPSPKAGMQVWNTHPRVYLSLAHGGAAKCPYCGTVYRLKAGEAAGGGH